MQATLDALLIEVQIELLAASDVADRVWSCSEEHKEVCSDVNGPHTQAKTADLERQRVSTSQAVTCSGENAPHVINITIHLRQFELRDFTRTPCQLNPHVGVVILQESGTQIESRLRSG